MPEEKRRKGAHLIWEDRQEIQRGLLVLYNIQIFASDISLSRCAE